jgi:mannose-1-phosphate guanylyltransferase
MNVPGQPGANVARARHVPAKALVLTAGLGTRLRPLSYVRAKAAVPVNGETLARRAVRWLVSHGICDLVLNLHHLPATITASVGDGADLGARVRYSWEPAVLGSAGGPRRALPLVAPDETFVIVNGDTLTDVDVAAMAAAHADCGAAVTMALIPNPRPDKYGGVQVEQQRWVTGFSSAGGTRGSYHFVGVQIVAARVFAGLTDGVPAETVNALYPALIARERHAIAAFITTASFRDIGTPSDYLKTSVELAQIEGDRMTSGARTRIDESASVVHTAAWDDVTIGAGAELVECVVGDGVTLPAGARYHRCAIVRAGGRTPQPRERIDGDLLIGEID